MKKILIPILCILSISAVNAQTLQTSYFSEDFAYSYRLNPAFHPKTGFVGLPFIGSTGVGYKGNFAINDLFYKVGGERVTFINDAVPSSEFLGHFKDGPARFGTESYSNLFAIGFKAGGMYNIVDVNIRSYSSGWFPSDFMRFLKDGAVSDGTYDLSGLRAHSMSLADIGITSSWKLTRKLRIGMRFKGVFGLNNSYIDMDRMNIRHTGNDWSVTADGVIASAYDGYDIKTAPAPFDPTVELIDFRKTVFGKPKGVMNGFGVGADIGFLYDDSSWQLSASVSDIGCVFWFHNLYGHSPSQALEYSTEYQPHHHGGTRVDNEFSDMGALLGDAFGFLKEDEYQSLVLLPLTLRLGAQYLYLSDLSFGGLATFRYDPIRPFWDIRGNVNYRPVKKVELIGSLGMGSMGVTAGAFANVRLGSLSIFAGTDNLLGSSISTFYPSGKGTPNFAAGLNIIW